ncbi:MULTISPECIES: efflux RND transporter periplasmic adaptor subunit [unclassified Tolypothrix]|uniref:efflux RND transporter periplasmic adaptor subunit n=1 Tax=unclassified Tolypothrix TaxID=2649714 RepID=UPI0005EAB281|nr:MULTISPECIES: efflux RND transporter periplasmic adaptor subunit [unclassified Tolypothrix]BAY92662.1 secretion protein HlyD [Microchaete diplosiphon NIES-3275]EKF05759.1 putative RND family protein [Tolypothrix sp. PCC 7601]MBE9087727.1 efflux RND transporter periplasmic adaptor subunit [Tolypothrix sp. LEGE 11397]UYD26602.1 efflux RND transporter periplasmic adaptor subunit [Tolypothrix sp. PCC 7712]UYD31162.1 efflux RND transporter periplasmic adaptor subunit [Tolypothrix sp. PCC 7601]
MNTHIEIPVIGKKIKYPMRWLIGLITAGALVVGTTTTYNLVNRGNTKQDISQLTVPVETQTVTLRITASGKVVPVQSVNISPKNPGVLGELYVEQGDRVQKGQVIARMDVGEIQAQILQYQANIAQAQAQLDEARAGSRPQEIAQAKARLAQAQAQLAAARAGNRAQEIGQAQAQVESAKAQVNLTQARVVRYQELTRQGATSQDQLDQYVSENSRAKAALEEAQKRLSLLQSGTRSEEIDAKEAAVTEASAALVLLQNGSRPEEIAQRQAAVKAAQAQLKAAQVRLADTEIRAPFNGIVTQKYANVGSFVTPTTSASSSASATSSSIVAVARGLEVLAQVPETDIGRIKPGQQVEIVADAYPDQVFKGRVRLIAPEAVVEQGVTSFQVRVALDTGIDKLRSGLNVDLTFLGDRVNNALVIPTVAIVTEKGQTGVLIPDENNKPQFRQVTVGAQIQDQTQVLEGVQTGDRIFVNPPKDYKIEKAKGK